MTTPPPASEISLDPYSVLGLPPTCTAAEIRSAYRKLALQTHPDKASPSARDAAHKAFQDLAFAYSILSDDSRRKWYDLTGSTAESFLDSSSDFDWSEFFKSQYQSVGKEAIEQFRLTYQGSSEERRDLLAAYTEFTGDLDKVFENVVCSSILDDEGRFRETIDEAIKNGEVEAYKKYTKESEGKKKKRRENAKREAVEAEEYAKELGVHEALFGRDAEKQDGNADGDEEEEEEEGTRGKSRKKVKARGKKREEDEQDTSALESLIKKRNQNRMSDLVDSLEAKYGSKNSNKRKGKRSKKEEALDEEEPDEEEFLAAQAKLGKKRTAAEAPPPTSKRSKRTKK